MANWRKKWSTRRVFLFGTLNLEWRVITFRDFFVWMWRRSHYRAAYKVWRIVTFIGFFVAMGVVLIAFANGSKTLSSNAFLAVVVLGTLHLLTPTVLQGLRLLKKLLWLPSVNRATAMLRGAGDDARR